MYSSLIFGQSRTLRCVVSRADMGQPPRSAYMGLGQAFLHYPINSRLLKAALRPGIKAGGSD